MIGATDVVINVTGQCNLNCLYCELKFPEQHMPLDTFSQIIEDHIDEGYFILTGGEPTQSPYLRSMLSILEQNKLPAQIITNGTAIKKYLGTIQNTTINLSLSTINIGKMDAKDKASFQVLPYLNGKKIVLSPVFRNNAKDMAELLMFAMANSFGVTINTYIQTKEPSDSFHVGLDIDLDELARLAVIYEDAHRPSWFVEPDTFDDACELLVRGEYWRCDPERRRLTCIVYNPDGSIQHCPMRKDVEVCGGCVDLCAIQADRNLK